MKNFNFSIACGCTAGASDLKYDIPAIVSSLRENFAGCTYTLHVRHIFTIASGCFFEDGTLLGFSRRRCLSRALEREKGSAL